MNKLIHISATLCTRAAGAVLGFLLSIIAVRTIGQEETGRYFFLLSIVFIVSTLARGGMDNILVRYYGSHSKLSERSVLDRLFTLSQIFTLCISSILVVMFAYAESFWVFLFPKIVFDDTFYLALFTIIPFSLSYLNANIFKGLNKLNLSIFITNVFVNGVILIFFSIGFIESVLNLVWVFSIANLALTLISYFILINLSRSRILLFDRAFATKIGKESSQLLIVSVITIFNSYGPVLILALSASEEQVGVFGVLFRTSMIVTLLLQIINGILAPKVACFHRENKLNELNQIVRYYSRLLILTSLPVLTAILIWAESFLEFIFDESYRDVALAFRILMIGQVVNIVTGSVGTILMMIGESKPWRNFILIGFVTFLILSILLSMQYGMVGLALAISLGLMVQMILAFLYLKRKHRISSIFFIPVTSKI